MARSSSARGAGCAALFALLLALAPGLASAASLEGAKQEVKTAAHDIGHGIVEGAHHLGPALRETGHAIADGARTAGHAIVRGARQVGQAIHDTVHPSTRGG